jgi:hypothetical protein
MPAPWRRFPGLELGVLDQRARRRLRVGAAAADGDDALLGLEHVAVAGDDQRMLAVGHRQHGLEPAQHAVGAPVLGQLDRAAQQVALVLVELGLEALEEGEGVGGAAGEAGEDLSVVERAHLARGGLDDDVAEGDLAVAAERDTIAAPHRQDGGAAILLHDGFSVPGEAGAGVLFNDAG